MREIVYIYIWGSDNLVVEKVEISILFFIKY